MKTNLVSDAELLQKTKHAAEHEKVATLELLRYLLQVDERRAYATLACSSLFEYVVRILGYSETQASERVNSVRLMRAVPSVVSQIQSGALSMTTASQVQRFIRQEKKTGHVYTPRETLSVIETCVGQSKREVEKTLFALLSDETKIETSEKIKELSAEYTELKFAVTEKTFQKLNEVRDLIGNESLHNIFDQALDSLLAQVKKKKGVVNSQSGVKIVTEETVKETAKETAANKFNSLSPSGHITTKLPKVKPTFPATSEVQTPEKKPTRFISMHTKRQISERSGNQCEYRDRDSGQRCQSRHKLEFDHYPIPFSQGGKNDATSLRHACFQHNQRFAMDVRATAIPSRG